MAEKVTLKLSSAAAAYLGKDIAKDVRIQAARGEIAVSGRDLVHLLYFLAHDTDQEVKEAAIRSLRALPETQLLSVAGDPLAHPRILEMLARLHFQKSEIVGKLLTNPSIEERTVTFLTVKQTEATICEEKEEPEQADEEAEPAETTNEDASPLEESEEVDEESEEFQTKYQLSLKMDVAEKIKVALSGDKEWRALLIRDNNKLVCTSVLKNPRISEGEVLAVTQSAAQNDDMIRIICGNKDWLKIYQIRKALVQNCRTPVQTALRLMMTLTEKDLAALVKSKNVSSVITTNARKLLFNKRYKNQ